MNFEIELIDEDMLLYVVMKLFILCYLLNEYLMSYLLFLCEINT